jgi:hypothetical protein
MANEEEEERERRERDDYDFFYSQNAAQSAGQHCEDAGSTEFAPSAESDERANRIMLSGLKIFTLLALAGMAITVRKDFVPGSGKKFSVND